jgi:peptidoglycan/LPS O-acetylase OafA/YrhL
MEKRHPLHWWLVHLARGLALLSGLIGATVLVGWMLGVAPLRDLTGVITMKTNTALAMLLAGAGLVLLIPQQTTRGRRYAGQACAAVVLALGAMTFSEHLIGWNLRIDQLLATEPPGAAGVTSPQPHGAAGIAEFSLVGGCVAPVKPSR